jgi:hypothetical protein
MSMPSSTSRSTTTSDPYWGSIWRSDYPTISGLCERGGPLHYDETGQLLTSTLADYLLPSMTDVPPIEVLHIETLSPLTPLGNKGMGEAGAIGPMAAIGNAVSDALDRCVVEVPLTPRRVWELANAPGGYER